jgi:nitroreductase
LARFRLGNEFMAQASALVLVFQDRAVDTSRGSRGAVWRQLGYQDAAAAIQNMLLLATACELGSCWVSAFANMDGTPMLGGRTWAEALEPYGLSPSLEIMGIVALARVPAEALAGDETHHGRPRARRPLREYLLCVDGVRP